MASRTTHQITKYNTKFHSRKEIFLNDNNLFHNQIIKSFYAGITLKKSEHLLFIIKKIQNYYSKDASTKKKNLFLFKSTKYNLINQ